MCKINQCQHRYCAHWCTNKEHWKNFRKCKFKNCPGVQAVKDSQYNNKEDTYCKMCRDMIRGFYKEHGRINYTMSGTYYKPPLPADSAKGFKVIVPKNAGYGWVRGIDTPSGEEWDEEEKVAKANGYYPLDDREVEERANGRPWFKTAWGAYIVPRHNMDDIVEHICTRDPNYSYQPPVKSQPPSEFAFESPTPASPMGFDPYDNSDQPGQYQPGGMGSSFGQIDYNQPGAIGSPAGQHVYINPSDLIATSNPPLYQTSGSGLYAPNVDQQGEIQQGQASSIDPNLAQRMQAAEERRDREQTPDRPSTSTRRKKHKSSNGGGSSSAHKRGRH